MAFEAIGRDPGRGVGDRPLEDIEVVEAPDAMLEPDEGDRRRTPGRLGA
jgi:hypothetical protein